MDYFYRLDSVFQAEAFAIMKMAALIKTMENKISEPVTIYMNNQAIQGIKAKLVRYLVASLSSINKSTLLIKMGILTGHCNIRSKTLKRNISTVDRFLPIIGIFGKK